MQPDSRSFVFNPWGTKVTPKEVGEEEESETHAMKNGQSVAFLYRGFFLAVFWPQLHRWQGLPLSLLTKGSWLYFPQSSKAQQGEGISFSMTYSLSLACQRQMIPGMWYAHNNKMFSILCLLIPAYNLGSVCWSAFPERRATFLTKHKTPGLFKTMCLIWTPLFLMDVRNWVNQGQQTFSTKDQRVNILGFMSSIVYHSYSTLPLCNPCTV